MSGAHRVLLVDLNNFARYPTLPIGYMAAVLRRAGAHVRVYSPLTVGVGGVTREQRPHRFSLLAAKLNHRISTSPHDGLRRLRDRIAAARASDITAHHDDVVRGFTEQLARERPEVVLISTYLLYRSVCERICALCRDAGIPVLIGGPYFAQPEVIDDWMRIDGLTALAAGEVELRLPAILDTLRARGDLSQHDGMVVRAAQGGVKGVIAPPLSQLDAVPFPDYSDFPWQAYPQRIVPVITGRGCGWGVCTFCSDVTSTAGRSYRSRSPSNVLDEIARHHRTLGVQRFVFTDLKLNSNLEVWRALAAGMQIAAPGAQWIGAVHVGHGEDGLSEAELRAAAASGCVRLTTGLETGSDRVAELMKKGARREAASRFLRRATAAGISTRVTMVTGYPGERAEDLHASAEFLEEHAGALERVSLNRLQLVVGTALHRRLRNHPQRFPGVRIVSQDMAQAQVSHHSRDDAAPEHRRAMMRLLDVAHRINGRELMPRARDFEGVM